MKRFALSLAALVSLFIGGGKCQASTILFDNGVIAGGTNSWVLDADYGLSVTDSFTISSPSILSSAEIGVWVFSGDSPTTVAWSIGITPYGSNISSGSGSVYSSYLFTNGEGYDICDVVFPLSGSVGPGPTYWFTLTDSNSSLYGFFAWDENDSSSTAYDSAAGSIGSESFEIYGSTVPEPSNIVYAFSLLVMAGLLGYVKRHRKQAA